MKQYELHLVLIWQQEPSDHMVETKGRPWLVKKLAFYAKFVFDQIPGKKFISLERQS